MSEGNAGLFAASFLTLSVLLVGIFAEESKSSSTLSSSSLVEGSGMGTGVLVPEDFACSKGNDPKVSCRRRRGLAAFIERIEPVGFTVRLAFMRICQLACPFSLTSERVGLDGREDARLVATDTGRGTPAASAKSLSSFGELCSKIVSVYLRYSLDESVKALQGLLERETGRQAQGAHHRRDLLFSDHDAVAGRQEVGRGASFAVIRL